MHHCSNQLHTLLLLQHVSASTCHRHWSDAQLAVTEKVYNLYRQPLSSQYHQPMMCLVTHHTLMVSPGNDRRPSHLPSAVHRQQQRRHIILFLIHDPKFDLSFIIYYIDTLNYNLNADNSSCTDCKLYVASAIALMTSTVPFTTRSEMCPSYLPLLSLVGLLAAHS